MQTIANRYASTGRWIVEEKTRPAVIVGFRDTFVDTSLISTVEYVIKEADTFPDLALKFYKEPERWYVLADANTFIEYPLDIGNFVGYTIQVPRTKIALQL